MNNYRVSFKGQELVRVPSPLPAVFPYDILLYLEQVDPDTLADNGQLAANGSGGFGLINRKTGEVIGQDKQVLGTESEVLQVEAKPSADNPSQLPRLVQVKGTLAVRVDTGMDFMHGLAYPHQVDATGQLKIEVLLSNQEPFGTINFKRPAEHQLKITATGETMSADAVVDLGPWTGEVPEVVAPLAAA